MPGQIFTAHSDTGTIIIIKGRFCADLLHQFRLTYLTHKEMKKHRFIIDMAGTEHVDSAAIGMMLMMREEIGINDRSIAIVNAPSPVLQALKIANMNSWFTLI
jgi:anti-anti-sigma regulatory factor